MNLNDQSWNIMRYIASVVKWGLGCWRGRAKELLAGDDRWFIIKWPIQKRCLSLNFVLASIWLMMEMDLESAYLFKYQCFKMHWRDTDLRIVGLGDIHSIDTAVIGGPPTTYSGKGGVSRRLDLEIPRMKNSMLNLGNQTPEISVKINKQTRWK